MLQRIVKPGFIAFCVMLCACSHSEGGSSAGPPATGLPSADEITAVPMGHIAGVIDSAALARSIPNPYEGNPQAIASCCTKARPSTMEGNIRASHDFINSRTSSCARGGS